MQLLSLPNVDVHLLGGKISKEAQITSTVYAFTQKNPKAWILATGSTSVRSRLYRIHQNFFI